MPGASRPLPGGRYELCSTSPGFQPESDAYRYLIQRADGDFAFSAVVESIDDRGLGGIAVRWDERSPQAAYVRITARLRVDGAVAVRSAVRLDNGDQAEEDLAPAEAAHLPVRLRIARLGDKLLTSWAEVGDPLTEHLEVDIGGTDLDTSPLVVGLVQASEDTTVAASAVFGEAGFATHEPVDPNPCVGGLVTPLMGGHELFLTGRNLHLVSEASIAGVPARIVEQTRESLRLETGRSSGHAGYENGKLSLSFLGGRVELPQKIAYAGVPFVRGDIDGDGSVGSSDLMPLSRYLRGLASLSCREAADVNGDRRVDGRDLGRLILPRAGFRSRGRFQLRPAPAPEHQRRARRHHVRWTDARQPARRRRGGHPRQELSARREPGRADGRRIRQVAAGLDGQRLATAHRRGADGRAQVPGGAHRIGRGRGSRRGGPRPGVAQPTRRRLRRA
jgi:hypothetical protein